MPKNSGQLRPSFAGFRQQPGGNFAFTMVPNQFLDEIVPYEKPCVVKVVGLILRRTLGWIDQRGQRRQQDRVSYSEFAREMNMSLQAVSDGLKTALDRGYILRVKPGGVFGSNPEAAWYSLRWSAAEAEMMGQDAKVVVLEQSTTTAVIPQPSKFQSGNSSESQSKATLKFRDMRNKAESKNNSPVEIKAKTNSTPGADLALASAQKQEAVKAEALANPKPATSKFSAYIGNVITEIGEQFGDSDHRLPNIKQALNLWDNQKLTEREFVQMLYQARDTTRAHTSALGVGTDKPKDQETYPKKRARFFEVKSLETDRQTLADKSSDQPRNRMPYFFRVLKELINRPTAESGAVELALANTNSAESYSQSSPALNEQHNEWAKRWSLDPAAVITDWQDLHDTLTDPILAAIVRRVLGIRVEQARPELLAACGRSQGCLDQQNQIQNQTEMILLCQNSFEARYVTRQLAGLAEVAGKLWQNPVTFRPVCF